MASRRLSLITPMLAMAESIAPHIAVWRPKAASCGRWVARPQSASAVPVAVLAVPQAPSRLVRRVFSAARSIATEWQTLEGLAVMVSRCQPGDIH